MKCVIGIDYGTQSARAVLMDVESGAALASDAVSYAHGTGDDGLIDARDYDDALSELLRAVCLPEYRSSIVGICVDATSLTLVPVSAEGKALCYDRRVSGRPQAQIKLWKRHQAQPQTEEALALAKQCGEPFLHRTGGQISSEWMLPKLMETQDEDPAVWRCMDRAMDLCEYLTMQLTGVCTRSMGSMCFKGLWAQDLGFPSSRYLDQLRPGLGEKYAHLLRGKVLCPGRAAGRLRPEWCARLGLEDKVVVASGVLDGHTSLAAMGALHPGDAALVVGTSNVLTVQTDALHAFDGVCGIARDGFVPGAYGIDAGQSCTGDMLAWYLQNALPKEQLEAAEKRGLSIHQWLTAQIREPWKNRVLAVDWWNGSRNAPCDLALPGALAGMSLETRPEDIYLALLQAIVCGTREILALCQRNGVKIQRVMAAGGITHKNPLLMEQYANLLGRPIAVARAAEVPATGAAVFAAVAAGCYSSAAEAWEHMGVHDFAVYQPDAAHAAEYERLYQQHHILRTCIRQAHRQMEAL